MRTTEQAAAGADGDLETLLHPVLFKACLRQASNNTAVTTQTHARVHVLAESVVPASILDVHTREIGKTPKMTK